MILDKLKAYGAIAVALVLGALLLVQTSRLHTAQLSEAKTKTEQAAVLKNIAELTAKAVQAQQHQTNLWNQLQEENANETLKKINAANVDRDTAKHAADRLQNRINSLVTEARRASKDSGIGDSVTSTKDPIGVLAELFTRAVARARFLAHYADTARIAGQSCERDYEALRATVVPLAQ